MDYQLVSVSISCDEDSTYYQCELELRDHQYYADFHRDQPFLVHLFNQDYQFVVDSRTLNRGIDDEGNQVNTVSISGLSPLCMKASPRATPITKTWDTPTFASLIVEELLGPVTWELVDWMIPAYRLAAEKAYPLDIANQIVNAVGGLIESQPDGTIMCRHRWPTSIKDLESVTVDYSLFENTIYAITESPTNDDLMNRVRILDQEASYQDKLEYVPNKLGDNDDPHHGILYAFLSPWRDGLRIVTTRPSAIQLGVQSEGTRVIADSNPDYPAEVITFAERESSVNYPVMQLTSVDWLDEDLGSVTVAPYATSLTAGDGQYGGYSLAKVEYTTRFIAVPVTCINTTEPIEAQFLLLENQDG